MKPRTSATTPEGHRKHQFQQQIQRDYDRGIKQEKGVIRQINSKGDGKLFVLVDIMTTDGKLRAFGKDKISVVITDSPLDILLRWGGVKVGQIVELTYRGIGESGQASARIIGDETEELSNARVIPKEGFKTESSLPFEPGSLV